MQHWSELALVTATRSKALTIHEATRHFVTMLVPSSIAASRTVGVGLLPVLQSFEPDVAQERQQHSILF